MGKLQPPTSAGFHPSDLTANLTGDAVNPVRTDRGIPVSKRKQTLLSLLDALNELKNEEGLSESGIPQQPSIEPENEGPSADEHYQVVGAEAFNKFQRRINSLDRELRNFANASRQLGSSVGILSSSFHLRERIAQILFLFRENAADLFPRKVSRQPKEAIVNLNATSVRKRMKRHTPAHVARPIVSENLDAEDFPYQLAEFARDVTTFLKSLNEFPEFTDEAVNNSISLFEGDLKYWASCLKTYEGQFKYPGVQRYLHDLTSEMGEHLDTITSSLSMFLEIGIPTIRFAQKHAATNLLNLTTVATFFSAVTATTLQFSFNNVDGRLENAVNAFWFCSLVFSIASAVNSLLGLTWKQAMYRSPGHRVPWWVLIWIKRSPLIFLVVSVAAFSIGLCLFAYSSGQDRVTSILTTVFTAFSSFGLIAVSAWFAFERWTFTRHKGKKWLMDVLADFCYKVYSVPLIGQMVRFPTKLVRRATSQLRRTRTSLTRVSSRFGTTSITREKPGENGECTLPIHNRHDPLSPVSATSPGLHVPQLSEGSSATDAHAAPSSTSAGSLPLPPSENVELVPGSPKLPARSRFAGVVRSVMMMRTVTAVTSPRAPRRQRTTSSTMTMSEPRLRSETMEPFAVIRGSRAAALVSALKSLEPTQDFTPHQALVRHLQFSPNGKFLATCSWDRTCVVFNVGNPFSVHRILAHPQGFVGQVAWSPSGNSLLTKMNRGVKVWTTESGVCRKTIDRRRAVQSIAWCPDGESFMSVEDSIVTKLDLTGNILDSYHFPCMKLHDVAIAPIGASGSQRLLGVTTLLASSDGLKPSKSRAEKQIIVYNLDKKEIENQVPVLHDVRDITLAKNGKDALVSYEYKAPPQLWRIEIVRDRHNESKNSARLALRHTYMPKMPVDFAGPSYFGGKDDQLVLCAGKAGDIHIWERETGALLHHFRAQDLEGDLTCIAWNHAADPFMFSTGSHDGAVRIWTTPPPLSESVSETQKQNDEDTPLAWGEKTPRAWGEETPRSETPPPFTLDALERTDSPMTQQDEFEFESLDEHTHGDSSLRERREEREIERRSIAFMVSPRSLTK